MKLLVATTRGQGRPGDFSWTVEGELVRVMDPCDRDLASGDPLGGCGCGRAFSGLASMRGTTTARVGELAVSETEVLMVLHHSLVQAGYLGEELDDDEAAGLREELSDLERLAAPHPVGTVVERSFDLVRARH